MGFILEQTHSVPSLKITGKQYRHEETDACHIHIESELDENVFLVALRTIPEDSTGVAHILEHTALCGSEKYPVRDPFFMMIRRSLNTFMNAFTSSDWTAYPFASENRKDYFNLLDVYLDAVFFSRLDELDFKQEGHRIEFQDNDKTKPLEYKGVVFNEMKGALSSPVQKLWADFTHNLFKQATYHHNSGGDPKHIVDLSHQQLQDFYRKHYHPSNAVFMTFGNLPVETIQQRIEQNVLQRFERSECLSVSPEPRWSEPSVAQSSYQAESEEKSSHHLVGWLIGESTDLVEQLEAHLLSNVLLENSASPLRQLLETSDLGTAPSPLCGLEDSSKEMVFVCGIEGADKETGQQLETAVLDCLEKLAIKGVDQEILEAVLHQLELSQREIGGDHYPYGLQMILGSLPAALHGGDALAMLDINPVLDQLRENIKNPDYLPGLIRKLLIDNPHRLQFSMLPDCKLAEKDAEAEKKRLERIKAEMTDQDAEQVIALAEALEERQNQIDDDSILPKVGLEDVPADIHLVSASTAKPGLDFYKAGTNGISYIQMVMDLPELSRQELQLLPIYAHLLTEVGLGNDSYLDVQKRQTAKTGGISAWLSYKSDFNDSDNLRGTFIISAKALSPNLAEMESLISDTLYKPRFDEADRIREVLQQLNARKQQAVTGSGHSLAMGAASSYWSKGASLSHELSGLGSIVSVKGLVESIASDEGFDALAEQLKQLGQKLSAHDQKRMVLVSDQDVSSRVNLYDPVTTPIPPTFDYDKNHQQKAVWITNTQVNFCARAMPTVPNSHEDSAALTVLAGLLRNGYLHKAIREQGGAYGGGASHDPINGVFRFYSYRDPRLSETLQDFEASIDWLLNTEISAQQLEEAVLGVVSSIDKPGSPAGEAKQDFHNKLYGRTHETRKQYRQQVLEVTVEQVKHACSTWLKGKPDSIAVVTNAENAALADLKDFAQVQL